LSRQLELLTKIAIAPIDKKNWEISVKLLLA
jgi:hypothetical protein